MWDDLPAFAETVKHSYRRNVWATQPRYLECWLEKDALSGIFERILRPYGVTLNVGRGYDGWDSIRNAAERYLPWTEVDGTAATILYWGDFDPSGEDMVRSLGERLGFFDTSPEIIKCALTLQDVKDYHLPSDFAKTTDTRRAAFVERWGDVCVELDALPVQALEERLEGEVRKRLDLDALAQVQVIEEQERQRIARLLRAA